MKHINIFLILFIFLFFLSACSEDKTSEINTQQPARTQPKGETHETVPSQEIVLPETTTNYVTFTLNVHDWVFPEKSVEAVTKTIELHEKYNVPIDVYLDDQVFQIYMDQYPELVELINTSSVVTISYHIRPPMPTYILFEIFNLSSMTEDEVYDFMLPYEEHALDLVTALPDETKPGGYQYIKDTFGHAPVTISLIENSDAEKRAMAKIYQEKGARLGIVHGRVIPFGQQLYGMYLRPEDVEIKWYEQLGGYMNDNLTAESYLLSRVEEAGNGPGLVINIKMHEDNYYLSQTPFDPIYWTDSVRGDPSLPPYDLTRGIDGLKHKSFAQTAAQWEFYEDCLAYVSAHPELYTVLNTEQEADMIGA
ncbi:MAG: hypothetical protein WC254_07280 [Candidatus Woesearchaeota archaeon]|jgi:hypothetical protein